MRFLYCLGLGVRRVWNLSAFWLCVLMVVLAGARFFDIGIARADEDGQSDADVGATVVPVVMLSIDGGENETGKKTVFSGSVIDFGPVNFLEPSSVSNGDAFRVGDNLRLEAVIESAVDFSGIKGVRIGFSCVDVSDNPFHAKYVSATVNRAGPIEKIQINPEENEIKTVTSPQKFLFRVLLDIAPQQSGKLRDRFMVTGTPASI